MGKFKFVRIHTFVKIKATLFFLICALSSQFLYAEKTLDKAVQSLNRIQEIVPVDAKNKHCQYRSHWLSAVLASEGYLYNVIYVKSMRGDWLLKPNDKNHYGSWPFHVVPLLIPESLIKDQKQMKKISYALVGSSTMVQKAKEDYQKYKQNKKQKSSFEKLCVRSEAKKILNGCRRLYSLDSLSSKILVYDPMFAVGKGALPLKVWLKKMRPFSEFLFWLWASPGSYKSSAWEPDYRVGDAHRWKFYKKKYWRFQKPNQDGNGIFTQFQKMPPFSLETLLTARQVIAEDICLTQKTQNREALLQKFYQHSLKVLRALQAKKKIISLGEHDKRIFLNREAIRCSALSLVQSPWKIPLQDVTGEAWWEDTRVQKSYQMK